MGQEMFGSETPASLLITARNHALRATLGRYLAGRLAGPVLTAETTTEALRLAAEYRPRLVVFDPALPGATTDFVQALRQRAPGARVFALVGEGDLVYLPALRRSGVAGCLPREDLARHLRAATGVQTPPWRHWLARARQVERRLPFARKPRLRLLYLANVAGWLWLILTIHHLPVT
jgi:hypothetical protein